MNITYFGFLKYITNHSTLKLLRQLFATFFSQMAHAFILSHDIFSTDIFLFQCTDLMQLLSLLGVYSSIKDLFLE